jgi:hypothetical protein
MILAADKPRLAEIDIQFPRQLGNNDDRFGIIKKYARRAHRWANRAIYERPGREIAIRI